jgi:hypothetical protein
MAYSIELLGTGRGGDRRSSPHPARVELPPIRHGVHRPGAGGTPLPGAEKSRQQACTVTFRAPHCVQTKRRSSAIARENVRAEDK